MLKRLSLLVALLLAAAGLFAVTGCGSDSKESGGGGGGEKTTLELDKVVEATKNKGSAKMALDLTVDDGKEEQKLSASGLIDFKNTKIDASLDAGKLLEQAGVKGDSNVRLLVDGKKIWLKLPPSDGLALPGGKEWIALDLDAVIKQFNLEEQADKVTAEPAPPLEMEKVGTENLDGVEVTHLKADGTLREILDAIPDDKQRADAIAQIEKQKDGKKALDTPVKAEVWVDADNAMHKMTADLKVDDGDTKGELQVELRLSDFGTAVEIAAPAPGETFDATQLLLGAADQLQGSLGGSMKTQ